MGTFRGSYTGGAICYGPFVCFVGLLAQAVTLNGIEKRRCRRALSGRCAECNYDLTGNVSGICPECGAPTGREAKPLSRQPKGSRLVNYCMCVLVVCAMQMMLVLSGWPRDYVLAGIIRWATVLVAMILFGWLGGRENRTALTIGASVLFVVCTLTAHGILSGTAERVRLVHFTSTAGILCEGAVLLGIALLAQAAARNGINRRRRKWILLGLCPECGCGLASNAGGVCPKCGTPIPKDVKQDSAATADEASP